MTIEVGEKGMTLPVGLAVGVYGRKALYVNNGVAYWVRLELT